MDKGLDEVRRAEHLWKHMGGQGASYSLYAIITQPLQRRKTTKVKSRKATMALRAIQGKIRAPGGKIVAGWAPGAAQVAYAPTKSGNHHGLQRVKKCGLNFLRP